MREPAVDELEERRVVRRLASLADAVEPLPDEELERLFRRAVSVPVPRPCSRRQPRVSRHLPSVAAAAAAVLALAVGIGEAGRSSDDEHVGDAVPERLVSFPQGSALELLLSRAEAERPA